MPRKEALIALASSTSAQAQQDLVGDGIEKFELPKTLVTKIAKSAIPENAKLQKETVLALVKGSTVFINYLAATAHDVALSKQHKSISASDVLKALETIQFGDLLPVMQTELTAYRELAKTDKSRRGVANTTPATTTPGNGSVAGAKKGKGKAVNGKGKQPTEGDAMDVDNAGDEDTAGEDAEAADDDEEDEEQDEDETVYDAVAQEDAETKEDNVGMDAERYTGPDGQQPAPHFD